MIKILCILTIDPNNGLYITKVTLKKFKRINDRMISLKGKFQVNWYISQIICQEHWRQCILSHNSKGMHPLSWMARGEKAGAIMSMSFPFGHNWLHLGVIW